MNCEGVFGYQHLGMTKDSSTLPINTQTPTYDRRHDGLVVTDLKAGTGKPQLSDVLIAEIESLRISEIPYQAAEVQITEKLTAGGVQNANAVAIAILDYKNQGKTAREIIEASAPRNKNIVRLPRTEDLSNLVLQTERLEIRAMGPNKIQEALTAWGNPETAQMSGDYIDHRTATTLLKMGQTKLDEAKNSQHPFINFGIYLDGTLIGMSQVAAGQEETIYSAGKGNYREKWASISYHLNPSAWGKGFASEAAARLVRFAFETLEVTGLHAEATNSNVGSQAVLRKTGFIEFANFPGLPHGTIHFYLNRTMFEAKYYPIQNAAGH
jgi:RimJ/RimL family protein N-acetyltransferase